MALTMVTMEGIPLPNLPDGWQMITTAVDGYACKYRYLAVIVSAAIEEDGKRWWHISLSRKGGWLPNWDEVKTVKDAFIGRDKRALMVLASESEHVNLHEVHHIWYCLDGDVTPDFTGGSGSI